MPARAEPRRHPGTAPRTDPRRPRRTPQPHRPLRCGPAHPASPGVRAEPDGSRAKAFSVPRDTFVDIPGHGKDKIKKAYGLAKEKKQEQLAAQGVKDNRRLERDGREAGRPGPDEAAAGFLAGATKKLNSAGTFTDPAKLIKLIEAAKQDVVTDEGWDLLGFVKQAKNLSGGKVQFTTLPIEGFGRNHGEEINVVDDMKIKRLIADQIGPKASTGPGAASSPSSSPPSSPPSSAEAAPPRSSPPPSPPSPPASRDGGGIPCVD
ncbi:LCP family protein [Streptomyces avidinii]|nr:LCP family protein [Streptomyces avidinii]